MGRARSLLQLHLPQGWPGEDPPSGLRYARYVGEQATTGCAPLEELPTAATVVAVVPASAVTTVRVRLPDVRRGKLASLLPLAVEDAVACSAEDVHAVLVEHRPSAESLVAVTDRAWLDAVRARLATGGVPLVRMALESDLAAKQAASLGPDRCWVAVLDDADAFLRLHTGEHFALDASVDGAPWTLAAALDAHRGRGEAPSAVVVLGDARARAAGMTWGARLGVDMVDGGDWRPERIDARNVRGANLLEGLPALERQGVRTTRTLALAGIAAALVLTTHAGLTFGDWWRLSREATRLTGGMETRFREVFPEARSIVDAPLQMRRNLALLRAAAGVPDAADFVPMLAAAATPLAASGARASRVRYERGGLEVDVAVEDGLDPDALAKQITAPGYRVSLERSGKGEATLAFTFRIQSVK